MGEMVPSLEIDGEVAPRRKGRRRIAIAVGISAFVTTVLVGLAMFTNGQTAAANDEAIKLREDVSAQRTANQELELRLAKETEARLAFAQDVAAACASINYFNRKNLFEIILSIDFHVQEAMAESCPEEGSIVTSYFDVSSKILGSVVGTSCFQANLSAFVTADGTVQNPASVPLDIEVEMTFYSGGTVLDTVTALAADVPPGATTAWTAYGSHGGYITTSCSLQNAYFWPSD